MEQIRKKFREQAEGLVGITLFVAIVSLCCGLWQVGIICGALSFVLKELFE